MIHKACLRKALCVLSPQTLDLPVGGLGRGAKGWVSAGRN